MGHARQHSSTFCNTSVAAISAAFPSRKSKNEFFVSNTSLAHDWRIDIPPIYHLKHQKKNYLSSGISNFWDHPQSSSRFKLFQSPPQNSEKNQAAFLNSLGIQDTDWFMLNYFSIWGLFRLFLGFFPVFSFDFARPSLFHLFPNSSIFFLIISTCCGTVLSRPQHSGLWLQVGSWFQKSLGTLKIYPCTALLKPWST